MAHPSSALESFLDSITSAMRLADIERKYRDLPRKQTAPTVEALRGGICVLVVASFERFVSEAFEEHLIRLASSETPIPFSQLPDALKVSTIFESLDLAMKGPDFGPSGTKSQRAKAVIGAAHQIVDEKVDSAAMARTRGNPDSKRIAAMFKAIGIRKPFVDARQAFDHLWGKPESSSFLEDKLDEIVNARHQVAHTARALQISRGGLALWSGFLETLAVVLDLRLDSYASNVLSRVSSP